MKKSTKFSWSILLLALPVLFMMSGCKKFLDRKPLTATLDDIKQGGIESLVFGIYGSTGGYGQPGEGFSGLSGFLYTVFVQMMQKKEVMLMIRQT